jgi:hypothetical protein
MLSFKKNEKRISPTPPSFSKTPAKIIEPKVGASTCATGNQWCKPNTGNFTKKIKTKSKVFNSLDCAGIIKNIKCSLSVPVKTTVSNIKKRKGKLKNKVYWRSIKTPFERLG